MKLTILLCSLLFAAIAAKDSASLGVFSVAPALASPARVSFPDKSSLQAAIKAYNADPTSAEFGLDGKFGPIEGWNVSAVTDMSLLFDLGSNINVNISSWDTSGVTDMSYMFYVRSQPHAHTS